MREQQQVFEFGQPYFIAYKLKPLEVRKEWGTSWLYKFTNGKIAFLPPEAHDEIKSLNLSRGESFRVMRIRKASGAIGWEVERDTTPGLEPRVDAIPDPVTSSATIAPDYIRKPITLAGPTLTTNQSQFIMRQLVAAIEVAAAAEKYALSALGRKIEFSHEDIRALAISGFIQQSREAA